VSLCSSAGPGRTAAGPADYRARIAGCCPAPATTGCPQCGPAVGPAASVAFPIRSRTWVRYPGAVGTWHDPDLVRPIAAPLERCAELLGIDLAIVHELAANVEPYRRADSHQDLEPAAAGTPAPTPGLPPAPRWVPGAPTDPGRQRQANQAPGWPERAQPLTTTTSPCVAVGRTPVWNLAFTTTPTAAQADRGVGTWNRSLVMTFLHHPGREVRGRSRILLTWLVSCTAHMTAQVNRGYRGLRDGAR
jgi:hypothetical protein